MILMPCPYDGMVPTDRHAPSEMVIGGPIAGHDLLLLGPGATAPVKMYAEPA
jgi:hypothetical protein